MVMLNPIILTLSIFSLLRDARVMWDQKTGRSRGFGFVSFRNQQVSIFFPTILLWFFYDCTTVFDIPFYATGCTKCYK